jgi:hypothetical protein
MPMNSLKLVLLVAVLVVPVGVIVHAAREGHRRAQDRSAPVPQIPDVPPAPDLPSELHLPPAVWEALVRPHEPATGVKAPE